MAQISSEQVWQEIEKQMFGILGMVTAKNEARTVGIVYVVHGRQLFISTKKSAWKTKHIAQNPHVSLTIPIHKRIPFLPWIKIPAATITFSGTAVIQNPNDISAAVLHALYQGREDNKEILAQTAVLAIKPVGDFMTYGVGVSLKEMRDSDKARGRTAVAV
jgi:hypothetical protein